MFFKNKEKIDVEDIRNKLKNIQTMFEEGKILSLNYTINDYEAIATIKINYQCNKWLDINITPAILSDEILEMLYNTFKDYNFVYKPMKSAFIIKHK